MEIFLFSYGDYIVIPRGTIYQLHFHDNNNRLFIVESTGPVTFPKGIEMTLDNYWNTLLIVNGISENLKYWRLSMSRVILKYLSKQDYIYPYHYLNHPFDVIGWDGFVYPYVLSIHDFRANYWSSTSTTSRSSNF